MKIDPAILRALSLPPEAACTLSSHGGSGFAFTGKLTATVPTSPSDNSTTHTTTGNATRQKDFFIKTSTTPGAESMFRGEHASLNAIHAVVQTLCPASFAHGTLDEGGRGAFLVTEFLELGGRAGGGGKGEGGRGGMSLAEKLAKLHGTPAPAPETEGTEKGKPMFGFPVPTCCGDTEQDNTFTPRWADFFAERRLLSILKKSERTNGPDASLRKQVERTAREVVPRLIADEHLNQGRGVTPVVVHGDLWSGNKGRGRIGGRGGERVEDLVFDPSSCYAHSEYELGIMRMFGGFGPSFMREYHALVPKTEPVEEYEDRVSLYELYHHLNHHAIFGGGYKSGAMSIMKDLLRKYGDKNEL